MKKITLALMAALALACVMGFVGCAKEPAANNNNSSSSTTQTTASIVGTGKYTGEESFPDTLVFNASGTFNGYVEGEVVFFGSYVASSGSVTLSMEDEDGNNIGLKEMPDELNEFLQKHHFGGVIFFADNMDTIDLYLYYIFLLFIS